MNKLYTVAATIGLSCMLLSFSTNPPDGNTGAPGEQFCVQCHVQTNPSQNGTITLTGFPEAITPNETYLLQVTNRITQGEAVRAGFQVTILSPFNTRAGDFTSPSANSAVSVFGGRQYWDHNPAPEYPDSNVVSWTVLWKAPNLAAGSEITWYAAGNIADGNFQNTGDKIVAANGSGIIMLSDVEEVVENKLSVYPNPGNDHINILSSSEEGEDGSVSFYSLLGHKITEAPMFSGKVNVPSLASGVYLLEIKTDLGIQCIRWSKF